MTNNNTYTIVDWTLIIITVLIVATSLFLSLKRVSSMQTTNYVKELNALVAKEKDDYEIKTHEPTQASESKQEDISKIDSINKQSETLIKTMTNSIEIAGKGQQPSDPEKYKDALSRLDKYISGNNSANAVQPFIGGSGDLKVAISSEIISDKVSVLIYGDGYKNVSSDPSKAVSTGKTDAFAAFTYSFNTKKFELLSTSTALETMGEQ